MNRHKLCEFDWCHFCKHDDWYSGHKIECRRCTQKDNKKPSHFEEDESVTAYREALSATAEM